MEIVFEFIIKFIKSKKTPKIIRNILISAISMIFICVTAILIYAGFVMECGLLSRLLLFGTGLIVAAFPVKLVKDVMERAEQSRDYEG
ncbi:hypothetical protein OBV_27220 [Oscillibacter valericigenes Sjm18-20]|nr:hypothetical protein OBV_27220 [Oscillibacter valericigenes Sjm18-20]